MLASGTQVRGFKPDRSRRIFRAKKSSARLPSEGKYVPCRNLRHVKEPKSDVEVATFNKILGNFSLLEFARVVSDVGTPGGGSWNVLITGPPSLGFDVPLATAFCKNLPAANTQR